MTGVIYYVFRIFFVMKNNIFLSSQTIGALGGVFCLIFLFRGDKDLYMLTYLKDKENYFDFSEDKWCLLLYIHMEVRK